MFDFRKVFFCIVSLLIVYATVYVLRPLDAIANSNQKQQEQQRARQEQQERQHKQQMAQQRAQKEQQEHKEAQQRAQQNQQKKQKQQIAQEKQSKANDKEVKKKQVKKNTDKDEKKAKSNTKATSNLVKNGTGAYAGDCVTYLRNVKKIKFPPNKNLTLWPAKQSIINSQQPKKGCVAVIKESGIYAENGHVAEVTKVSKNEIVLQEANSNGPGYFTRTIKGNSIKEMMASNNIEGFYDPSKK